MVFFSPPLLHYAVYGQPSQVLHVAVLHEYSETYVFLCMCECRLNATVHGSNSPNYSYGLYRQVDGPESSLSLQKDHKRLWRGFNSRVH